MAEIDFRDALDRENERAELSIYNEVSLNREGGGGGGRPSMEGAE